MLLSALLRPRADVSGGNDIRWVAIDPNSGFAYSPGMVNADAAMRNSAVYDCVKLLSEDLAKLPLIVYRRLPNGGKERAPNHSLYGLLKTSPNYWQTSFEFRQLMQAHLELRGNAYARILPGQRGAVDRLEPISSDAVTVSRNKSGEVVYRVATIDGPPEVLFQEEVFHLRGFSLNGLTGVSTIGLQAEAIAIGLAAQQFQMAAFKNGVRLSGVFTHPGHLNEKARENLEKSIAANHGGPNRAGGFMILEEAMTWKEMSMTLQDAQFLELRKLNRAEIAGIFRVPPHKIGDLDRATFSNVEQQALEYVTDALMSRLVRWEQAITRDLFIGQDRDLYFAEFLVDSLLRGDLQSRYTAYSVGINCGILNPDEARSFENMNPRPGGSRFWQPLNTATVGAKDDRLHKMLRITGMKLANKELVALRKAAAKFEGQALVDWANEFYRGYKESLVESLQLPREKVEQYINEGLTELRAASCFSDVISNWESERTEKLVEIALAA
jgi:HK97 family phage portal protein